MQSGEVLHAMNELAKEGYYTAAVAVQCADGQFVFVAGYK